MGPFELAAYRLLLLAFPPRIRREFGADMAQMFAAQLADTRRTGRSVVRTWLCALFDAARYGFAERVVPFHTGTRTVRRESRRWRWWMHAFQWDVRHAVRVLLKQPGITAIAVFTLALGIGANTAIFSAVNAVLLRPLPYADPDRIMMIWEKRPAEGVLDNVVAPADFLDWASSNTTFESMAAQMQVPVDLIGAGEPVRLFAGAVSPSFFDVFGVAPLLGRTFRGEDATPGRHRIVIVGHRLWTNRFSGSAALVGQTISLSGVPHLVVGVLQDTFEYPDDTIDLWVPLAFAPNATPTRSSHYLTVYGRTKPAVTLQQARADMDRIGSALEQQYPESNRGHGAYVMSMADWLRTPLRSSLFLLLAAVAFVLLIACVNVANLLLAKATARRREMAVRAAVGAGRARLAGQMITESLVLGVAGGAAGIVLASWATGWLRQLSPTGVPVVGLQYLGLEPRVLAFTFVLSMMAAVLFGFLPAWHLSRQDVNESLKDGGRSPAGVRRRLRMALVVSEIALASLLLIAAGLTVRSFQALLNAPRGFVPDHALTFSIALPASRYQRPESQIGAFERIEASLRTIPGARVVGATSALPLANQDARRGVGIEGREPTPDQPTRAHVRSVTPDYFKAMGIIVRAGRPFTSGDTATSPPVVVVTETMARRYWNDISPVGKRVALGGTNEWREVVGVVVDVKHWGLQAPVNPEMYLPLPQYPSGFLNFVIRTDGMSAALAAPAREAVRSIDPNLPLSNVRPIEEVAARSVASQRAGVLLLAVFGILALTLSAAGIYGVMSHLVALRTSEIGIRMTLGARPLAVMNLVVREGVGLALAGLALGVGGGIAVMRVFRAMLFEVSPADPLTIAVVTGLLLATAVLACIVPARRAMRVDPVQALRG